MYHFISIGIHGGTAGNGILIMVRAVVVGLSDRGLELAGACVGGVVIVICHANADLHICNLIDIAADFQVNIDGFLRVADYFFDGLFADWAVLDQIHQSQDQVQNTRSQICSVLDYLQTLMDQTTAEKTRLQQEIERLVSSIPM